MNKILIIILCMLSGFVFSQTSMYEQEPNNKPLIGNRFTAPMTILGSMQNKDQDLFIWNINDADADYFWNIAAPA